jgi:hypothetical protein
MINTNTDTFILSDIRQLVDDIVTLKATIEVNEKNEEDTSKQKADLNEKKKLLDEIQLGEKADYYYGLSLFALNKFLHAPFLSLNIHDYVKNTYNQDFEILTKLDQDRYSAEFKAIMENDGQFKERMKAMYTEFLKQNEIFSPALEQYSANGYNVLREATFKVLFNNRDLISGAVKSEDFETLKQI